jgi:hypothetical protein
VTERMRRHRSKWPNWSPPQYDEIGHAIPAPERVFAPPTRCETYTGNVRCDERQVIRLEADMCIRFNKLAQELESSRPGVPLPQVCNYVCQHHADAVVAILQALG